jgi:glutamate carboxypeptidase
MQYAAMQRNLGLSQFCCAVYDLVMSLTTAEIRTTEIAAAAPMLAQVEAWAAINTGTRNLLGLKTMAGLLADAFSALPGDIALVSADPVESVAIDGTVQVIGHGDHLHVRVRPEAPLQMLFTGHMDTVFPVDHAFQTLSWLEPGILGGPGVADMKGGIAIMLAALLAQTSNNFGYEVIINSDEEVGSPSSAALIARAAKGKLAAFTYEPSALPDGTLAGARAGSGNFSIIVSGKSAHAGRNPDDGRNALVAAADLAVQLKAASGKGFSCNPARIDGGGPNNVVPDRAVLRVNFRPKTPADEIVARALIDALTTEIAHSHDVTIHVHGGFGRPPKPMDAKAEKLFTLVKECGADLGQNIGWRDTGGVCDGNNIAACGVPVVDTMGVRGGSIHSSDEYMIAASLAERAALSALAISRIIDKGQL